MCEQQRADTHARRSERRFGAGMAAADDDDAILLRKTHDAESTRFLAGARTLNFRVKKHQGTPVSHPVTKPYGCSIKY
jgi:hypothetical protein